jgi:O-antigen/teichoic acid export membrane protein
MIAEFKRLAKHSAIYGLSNVLNKVIAFFLLPLYTRYLAPADYGMWELFVTTGTFLSVFLRMGLNSAIFKVVLHDGEQDEHFLLSTAFYFLVIFSSVVVLSLSFFAHRIAALILGSPKYGNVLRIVFLTALLDVISLIPLVKLRIYEESVKYSLVNLSNFVLGLLLNVYFIVGLRQGVEGLVIASAIQSAIFAVFLFVIFIGDLRLTFSFSALRDMLDFGWPLVPMGIASNILSMSDRYFLNYYVSLTDTGLYALGNKLGSVISLLVTSLQIAWPAVLFSVAKRENAKGFYSKLLTYFLLGFGLVGLGISILSPEVLVIITNEEYYAAHQVVPLVVLGYIFLGIYYITAVGTNLKNKTEYQALAVIVAALVHILLNFFMIPKMGIMGAAFSTAISYAVMATIACVSSLKFYSVAYEWNRIFKLSVVAIVLFWIGSLIHTGVLIINIILKLIVVIIFPVILYFLKFYSDDEVAGMQVVLLSYLEKLGIVPQDFRR